MQVANFEYTDQPYTLKLFGISLLSFIVLMIVLIGTEIIGVLGGFLAAFVIPIGIFWYGKRKIKRSGTIVINNSYSDFKLEKKNMKLSYADIATYHIERFNGASLIIKFKNGTKFRLMANANFSDHLQLGVVLAALDKSIQMFMSTNNVAIERKPSVFQRKWMLPLLIVLTTATVIAIAASILGGKPMQTSFYTSVVFLIVLWVGWLSARKK